MKWFRRHIILTNLVLIGIEISVACLVWFIFEGRQTFGPLNTYVIVCLSVVIASIAALNSLLASSIASDTQRPFIYTADSINVKRVGDQIRLIFNIYNSGSLPGKDVNTDITFFDKDEEITEENLSSKYESEVVKSESSILFPNSKHYHNFILDLSQENDLKLWNNILQGTTKCRIRTTYTSLGRKHITIQTEELAEQEWAEEIVTHPIPPQKWE